MRRGFRRVRSVSDRTSHAELVLRANRSSQRNDHVPKNRSIRLSESQAATSRLTPGCPLTGSYDGKRRRRTVRSICHESTARKYSSWFRLANSCRKSGAGRVRDEELVVNGQFSACLLSGDASMPETGTAATSVRIAYEATERSDIGDSLYA
jgi:hypothetical protein